MPAIECITFDLDDTLWDCMPVILNAEKRFYYWLGHHYPEITQCYKPDAIIEHRMAFIRHYSEQHPELKHNLTHLRKQWMRELATPFNINDDWIENGFNVFWLARNEVTLFSGVEQFLEQLKQRYTLGAITDGNADVTLCGLGDYFDFTIHAEEVGVSKPEPAIFEKAIQMADTDASQIIHIGDHPTRDILGALSMNMRTIWVNLKQQEWPHSNATPCATIETLDTLTHTIHTLDKE